MTTERPDDELLRRLKDALHEEPVTPDAATWARMEAALDELSTPAVAGATRGAPRRVLAGWRTPALALTFASLLTASAAAAAVATNTLPGPFRSIAYNLGLPVTSPGLYQAQQETSRLRASLHAHQLNRAQSIGESLATHLRALDPTDRSSIEGTADGLLRDAGVSVTGPGVGSTTTTTGSHHDGEGPSGGTSSDGSGDGSPGAAGPSTSTTSTLLPTITLPGVGADE